MGERGTGIGARQRARDQSISRVVIRWEVGVSWTPIDEGPRRRAVDDRDAWWQLELSRANGMWTMGRRAGK